MEHLSGSQPLSIDGLTFRNFQGDQDLPAMLEVFLSLGIQDHENILESVDDITNKYHHLTNCDPFQDVLIAMVNDRMVGYGRVHWRQLESSGDRSYFMEWWIRPEWYGGALEKAFLHRSKERLRQIIRQQDNESPLTTPAFSGLCVFEANATSLQPQLSRLLEEDGFQAVRWGARMTCFDLQNTPDCPMPAGLEVRPVKSRHYHQIWDALCDGFRDDPGYSQPSEDDYAGWRHSWQFQPELWQVAWEGNQVAGCVLNYITHDLANVARPKLAWTEDIIVRKPWRQRGLARALLARSMRMFGEMGFTQTSLGVDLNNLQGAPHLYESMGYKIVQTSTTYRKPVDL